MSDTPYPLPRETRESTILVGNGTVGPYGPSLYKIFDILDVAVFARAAGEDVFSDVTDQVTVTKTTDADYDTFSVTFDAAIPASTEWQHQARRVAERSVAVTRAGTLDSNQLEKELSKQATTQSEMRRDVDRKLGFQPDYEGDMDLPPVEDGKAWGWLNGKPGNLPVAAGDVAAAVAATAADRVQTGLDRIATAADRVATGNDLLATAADVVAAAASAGDAANYLSTIAGYTRTFASTAAGIAGTVDGQSFTIAAPDTANALALYNNVAGVAVDTSQRLPFWDAEAKAVANMIDKTDAFARLPSILKVATDNSVIGNLAASISGGLRLAPASSTGYVGLLLRDQSDGPYGVELDVTFTTSFGAASRGIGFAVGTGAARRWYAWAASGSVLERNQDGATIITNFGTPASRVLAQGNAVTVGLVINQDRTGFLTMTLADGTKQSCLLGSIPTGPIYVAAFGASGNIFTATAMRITGKLAAEKVNLAGVPANDNSDPLDSLIGRTLIGNSLSAPAEFSASPIAGNKIRMLHATGSNAHPAVLKTVLAKTPAPIRISANYKLIVSGAAAWAVMAIGEGTARIFIIYSITGGVVVFDNAGAIIHNFAGATASQAYIAGDTVGITLDIMPDRSGKLSIITPTGAPVRYDITAVPEGAVGIGMKAQTAGVEYEISGFAWSGNVSRLLSLTGAPSKAVLLDYTILPDNAGGAASGGFTCTGLDRITAGPYAGCWLVGSDGRTTDGTAGGPPGSFNAEVLILTPDFRRIMTKFSLGVAATSVQGVVFNKITGTSFWAAMTNNGTIRHYNLYGVSAGLEIAADRITWAYGLDGPTGLAHVVASNALWVTDPASSTMRLLSCVDGSQISSFALSLASRDQLHLDEANNLLYYSVGANGADGYVYVSNLSNPTDVSLAYGPLKYCQAPEGLHIDRETGILTKLSDGGYHELANPRLNIAIRYKVPLLAA